MPEQTSLTEASAGMSALDRAEREFQTPRRPADVLADLERVTRLLEFAESGLSDRKSPELLAELETCRTGSFGIEDGIRSLIRSAATRIPEHPEVGTLPDADSVTIPACLACGTTTATLRYSIEGVFERLVACDGCGLGTLFPMPAPERIASFYPAEYYGTPFAKFEPLVEFGVRLGARQRVRSLVSGIPAGGRVLDIGCGRGVMLRALLDLGYEAHGVEISADAAAGADPRAQIAIAPQLADAGYPSSSFDAVILWHVLEHLPQPDETLSEIRRLLKPGGRLVIAVPNFASWQSRATGPHWFHLDLPRHLFHFTPESLRGLLGLHGFYNCSMRHFALLQNPFGWLQSSLNALARVPRNSLYTLLHRSEEESSRQPLTAPQRLLLRIAYWIGLPAAGCVSLVEALFRRGGTIAITAELELSEQKLPGSVGDGRDCQKKRTPAPVR